MGAAGGAARGSLVNSRWVGIGYGRWVGGTFSDSPAGLFINTRNFADVD